MVYHTLQKLDHPFMVIVSDGEGRCVINYQNVGHLARDETGDYYVYSLEEDGKRLLLGVVPHGYILSLARQPSTEQKQ